MTFNEFLKEIRKKWVVANIGLLISLIGITIWITFGILITVFHIGIAKDLSDLILKSGFCFEIIGGIVFGFGLFVLGDEPV